MTEQSQVETKTLSIADHVRARREKLPPEAEAPLAELPWGLALSGGGIRSATFCFGLLKALAKNGLFHRFDILSTVSGGGYIGSTVGKLFQNEPARQSPQPLEVEAALANAETRLFASWLRANGRYLIPRGTKDLMFAAASYARNLLGVHVELAFLSIVLGCLVVGFDLLIWKWADGVFTGSGGWPLTGDGRATLAFLSKWPTVWLLLPLICWLGAVLSCAFWALPANKGRKLEARSVLTLLATLVGFLLLLRHSTHALDWFPKFTGTLEPPTGFILFVAALCSAWFVGVLFLAGVAARGSSLDDRIRNWLTTKLSNVLSVGLIFVGLGVVDYLAWSLGNADVAKQGNLGALLVLIAVALRAALPKVADLPKSLTPTTRRVVLGALNVAGLGLLALIVIFWISLVHRATSDVMFAATSTQLRFQPAVEWLLWLTIPILFLMIASSGNRDFLNRSSLFGFYRARLVRSYLGAANPHRFPKGPTTQVSKASLGDCENAKSDVTAVDPGDDVSMGNYKPHLAGGPVHLLNVCINQTTDPKGGLFNQDRKGLPLTVGPGGQISVDRGVWRQPDPGADLTLGSWMAISGAAVAPGLGGSTRSGVAAVLMMAGIRLGYWWDSFNASVVTRKGMNRVGKYGQFLSELRGRFDGDEKRDWFLSDGGHFENTGAYALLREKCGLIVIADCGADPRYAFGDLENLVRKARIDLQAEITFLRPKESNPGLPIAFGSLNEIASPESEACLAIARVNYDGVKEAGHIIIVKPNVCHGMAVDLVNFKADNPLFPQEPTTDQLFSEAQWESYFQLGYTLGHNIKIDQLKDTKAFVAAYFVDDDGAVLVKDAAGKQSLQFSLKRLSSRIASTGAVSASVSLGAITTIGLAGWQAVTSELNSKAIASHIAPAAYKELADIFGKLPSKSPSDLGMSEGHLGEMATALLRVGDAACNPRNVEAFRQSNLMTLMVKETKKACMESSSPHASCKALLDDDKVSKCLQEEPRTSCVPMYWTRDYASPNTESMNCWSSPSALIHTASLVDFPPLSQGQGEPIIGSAPTPTPTVEASQPPKTPEINAQVVPPTNQESNGVTARNEVTVSNRVCTQRSVYIQIYGPELRDSVRSLREPWRALGASVPPVEDVWDSARRAGRRLPQPFSVPTVVYHDEASLACAKALQPSGATPGWDVQALSKNLNGQLGVIEVWLPTASKPVDTTAPALAYCYQEDDRSRTATRYGVHCHATNSACIAARGDNQKVVQSQCASTDLNNVAVASFNRGWANSWYSTQAKPFEKPFPALPSDARGVMTSK